MSTTGHDAVEVRLFEAEDETGVLELLQAAFGTWPADFSGAAPRDMFRWKHMASPFGPSIRLVAVAGDAVVGFLAWLPWPMRAGGRQVSTMRAVDLAVHPAHRGGGVSMALIQTGKDHIPRDVAFTWSNPNQLSHRRVVRSGQGDIGTLPRFVRPRLSLRLGSMPVRIEAQTAAEALRDGVDPQLLLPNGEQRAARLTTAKDLDYLRWRYGSFPEYRAIRAGAGGAASGLAIFRLRPHGRFSVSYVCELLVGQSDLRTARRLLDEVRRAAPTDFISCAFPSRGYAARCGFIQSPNGAGVTVRPIHEKLVPDPRQRTSWELSLGDLEVL